MADTAVPIDGSERTVDVLSVGRAAARAVAASLVLTSLVACGDGDGADGGADGVGDGERAAAVALRDAFGALLAGEGGAAPAVPSWPDDLDFHPTARAESIELAAALHDADGHAYSIVRRLDRVAVRAPDETSAPGGDDFAFRDVLRFAGSLDATDGVGVPAPRGMLERATLGLAASGARELRVRDATLSLEPRATRAAEEGATGEVAGALAGGGDGQAPDAPAACALDHRLREGDGLSLRFRQRRCPAAERVGALVVATAPTLAVDGTLLVDGAPRAVSGRGWVRRVWGDLPAPGGAVVFDRLLLELDGVGLLDASRSKRRSGRGPRTTTASLRPSRSAAEAFAVDSAAAAAGSGGSAGAARANAGRAAGRQVAGRAAGHGSPARRLAAPEWLDAAPGAAGGAVDAAVPGAVPGAWTLRVPDAGIDVVLEPLVDAAVAPDLFGSAWRGAVTASGSHAGVGFVEYVPDGGAPP